MFTHEFTAQELRYMADRHEKDPNVITRGYGSCLCGEVAQLRLNGKTVPRALCPALPNHAAVSDLSFRLYHGYPNHLVTQMENPIGFIVVDGGYTMGPIPRSIAMDKCRKESKIDGLFGIRYKSSAMTRETSNELFLKNLRCEADRMDPPPPPAPKTPSWVDKLIEQTKEGVLETVELMAILWA